VAAIEWWWNKHARAVLRCVAGRCKGGFRVQQHCSPYNIATFDWLLAEADFNRNNKGALEMFKCGLNLMLKVNCIKQKPKPATMDEWQEAAREEQCDYLEVQHAMRRNPYNVKDTILKNLQKPMPTKFWKAKGPNAMEVDKTEAVKVNMTQRKSLTDEQ